MAKEASKKIEDCSAGDAHPILTEAQIVQVSGGLPPYGSMVEHYDANGNLISIVFKDAKGNTIFP